MKTKNEKRSAYLCPYAEYLLTALISQGLARFIDNFTVSVSAVIETIKHKTAFYPPFLMVLCLEICSFMAKMAAKHYTNRTLLAQKTDLAKQNIFLTAGFLEPVFMRSYG